MKRLALLLFLGGLGLVLSAQTSLAANHYVRAGASGTGNGADWANACADFTGSCAASSLVRGDTYYVAAGSYASPTFNTASSGSSVITIKGATAADHGTSTGWNNSYGVDVAQAKFANPILILSSYWTIDGNTGTPAGGRTSYGFTVSPVGGACSGNTHYIQIGNGPYSFSNITISHFGLLACTGDSETEGMAVGTQVTMTNITYSYSYFDGFQNSVDPGYKASGVVVDHNYMTNAVSYSDHHGEQVDLRDGDTNVTISNNQVMSCQGTACVAANCSSGGIVNLSIYGNVFSGYGGNGVIGAESACYFQNARVYNNTITNTASSIAWFSGCMNGNCSGAVNNVAQNNIIWNAACGISAGVTSDDYNSFFSCLGAAPSEAHGQVAALNPFVSLSVGNYHLAADTNPWNPSGIPGGDNIDPNGMTRSSSRGAFQFGVGSASSPPPPIDLQVVSVD